MSKKTKKFKNTKNTKNQRPQKLFDSSIRLSEQNIEPGTFEIDAGTAEIVPDPDHDDTWVLLINGAESSQLNPNTPRVLGFEYMRWAAAVIQHRFATSPGSPGADHKPLRLLHLGGAGCSMARWAAAVYPTSRQTAVEYDSALAALARERFGLPRSPSLKIRVDDAGAVLAHSNPGSKDVVMRDAFVDATTPPHLTGIEAAEAAAGVLEPGGLYLVNYAGGPQLGQAKAEAATLREVFDTVALIADPAMFKGRRRGNIIMVGTQGSLTDPTIGTESSLQSTLLSDPVPAHLKTHAEADQFISTATPITTPLSVNTADTEKQG